MGRNHRTISWRAAWRRARLTLLVCAPVVLPTGAFAQADTTVTAPKAQQSQSGAPALGGFSARALDENGQPTPQTYFKLELDPGDTYEGQLLVANSTKDALRLRVDAVDGLTGATSGTVYGNREDTVKEAGLWLTPKKNLLRVEAQEERNLSFTVTVPQDARPGDHVGALAFQSAEAPESSGGGQVQVKQVIRVAIAVQIRVKGPASASLKLEQMKLEALGGTAIPSVLLKMNNNGQLLCRPELELTLSADDKPIGRVSRQLDTILAGDTIDFPLPWPRALESGTYTGKAVATGCGKPVELEQEMTLGTELAGSTTVPGTAPDEGNGVPWWVYAIGGVLAAIVAFLIGRRGRKKDRAAAEAAAQAAREAEARAAALERSAKAKSRRSAKE